MRFAVRYIGSSVCGQRAGCALARDRSERVNGTWGTRPATVADVQSGRQTDNKKPARGGFQFLTDSHNMPAIVLTTNRDDFGGHAKSAKSLDALGCGGRI